MLDGSTIGKMGTYIEQLGQSRFLIKYEALIGSETALQLRGVHGRLEEPETLWLMTSPAAQKAQEIWMMDGPMDIEAHASQTNVLLGKGHVEQPKAALKWDHGIWTGMSTLVWDDLRGNGGGRWTLPPGWRRELDGRFVVENKPVHWEALGEGAIRSLDAQSLWVTLGFTNGVLEDVRAQVSDGRIQARTAELDPQVVRWLGPILFQRDDGWNGSADSGLAPRPEGGGSVQVIELKNFEAQRTLPGGLEMIQSEGARWTPAGIRAEGDVKWDQPKDGQRLVLRAPRVLLREAIGTDLPPDLPIGEARAEGLAVLSWGRHSLSSPRMDVQRVSREWRIQSPALGRSEQGTFSAGMGRGNPTRWEFDGPIRMNTPQGGNLRGDRLVWEDTVWTVTGRPATWNGFREHLSGATIVKKAEWTQFPDGINGSYSALEGDVVVRADRGENKSDLAILTGRVDCRGLDWHLQADRVNIVLGPDNRIRTLLAKGTVSIQGKISNGRGELLELDLDKRTVKWQGLVKGLTEVQP
jgi:hypothetical protein